MSKIKLTRIEWTAKKNEVAEQFGKQTNLIWKEFIKINLFDKFENPNPPAPARVVPVAPHQDIPCQETLKYCFDLATANNVKILSLDVLTKYIENFNFYGDLNELLQEEEDCYKQIMHTPRISPPMIYARTFFAIIKKLK